MFLLTIYAYLDIFPMFYSQFTMKLQKLHNS